MLHGTPLLLAALGAVAALVLLIAWLELNAFVTLLVVSLVLGLVVGMPAATVVKSFETGVGNVLGHVVLVVALGTMLGKLLAESGGAARISGTIVDAFGERRVDWAMACIAVVIGLPVFFEVGFVLLVPLAFTLARRTGASMVLVGIPMVAGLSVVHGLVPPHPAALLAVDAYGADMGRTLLYGLLVAIPTAAVAGPIFARAVSRHVVPAPGNPMMETLADAPAHANPPGFGVTLATLLLPVALMLVGSWANVFAAEGTRAHAALRIAGNPVVALLLALLVALYTLGAARGFTRRQLLRFTNECLAPTAAVTLVVGAGGGFGRILIDGGVSAAVVNLAAGMHVPPLLLGWLVAALIRVATGSATVAMTTACGIVAPVAHAAGGVSPELMVLATGSGSLILSHVNDGGFWLVKEYFGLTVTQTLQTWTVCETIIAVVGLALTLALSLVV